MSDITQAENSNNWTHETSFLLFLRPTIRLFCSQYFKVSRHVIEFINHHIVVDLCSELIMRLFYYIHLRYGESFCLTWGSNPVPSDCETSILPLDQSANSCCSKGKPLSTNKSYNRLNGSQAKHLCIHLLISQAQCVPHQFNRVQIKYLPLVILI